MLRYSHRPSEGQGRNTTTSNAHFLDESRQSMASRLGNFCLERDAGPELELPWIVRRCRCACRRVKKIHVQRIVFVDQVEVICRHLQAYLVRERKGTRDAQIRK